MLSHESTVFYNSWRAKANDDAAEASLASLFDAYCSHFIVFNRLYAEATFELARRGSITLSRSTFPDSKGAKEYSLQFVGANQFVTQLLADPDCAAALDEIMALIDIERFHIKLDMIYGAPQRGLDLTLLINLRSASNAQKGKAILDVLYSIRCNMFHGHKGFNEIQQELLRPAITLISKVSEILFNKLIE